MSIFRVFAAVLMLLASTLSTANAQPATRAASLGDSALWLDHSLREAATIADPVLQADAYAKAALLMARRGDVPAYRQTMTLAEQALGRATSKPAKSPIDDEVHLATTSLLRALAQKGDLTEAKAMAEERSKPNVYFRAGHYAAIAGGQVLGADLEGALVTANAVDEYGRRTVLKEIVSTLVTKKDFTAAKQVAGMIAPRESEWRDSVRRIAAGLAQDGQYEAALAMADQLSYSHDKQSVFQYVVEAQAKAGDYAAARATAARVPPAPEYARTLAYSSIAWMQLKRKDLAGSRVTAEQLDRDSRAQLDGAIAKAQVDAGDLAGARRTVESIPAEAKGSMGMPPRVEAYQALALALANTGDIVGAVQLARTLPLPEETQLDLADIAVTQGKHEQVRELLRDLKSANIAAPRFRPRGEVEVIRMAGLERDLGDPRSYDALVDRLKWQAAEPGDRDAQGMAAMQLFNLSVREGDMEGARRWAAVAPPKVLSWVVALLAVDAAKSGQMERARALAELTPMPEDRAAVLQSILSNSRNMPQSIADVIEQIGLLPSAYDRSLAYLDRAQTLWIDSSAPAP